MNVNNKNSLMSTAMLTYIWEEKKIDNLGLLIPFVLYIISKKYNVKEKIDIEYIITEMDKQFSFCSIPYAVMEQILKRLSKNNFKILLKDNKEYFLEREIIEIKDFEEKQKNATEDMNFVLSELKKVLIEKQLLNVKSTDDDVQTCLSIFLEKNGYSIIMNIDEMYKLKVDSDKVNYQICRFLMAEEESDTKFFKSFLRIIQGFMLANVIYLQVDNNGNQNYKNVEFYLDSPLMLSVLGYKSVEENRIASELIKLLNEQKAKIKCFEHNLKEVENIIEYYKYSKFGSIQQKKKQTNDYERTLEFFDENNYTESQIDIVLYNLRQAIANKGISITSPIDYNENKDSVISFDKLTEEIKKVYTRETKETTIYNDVCSLNAINMIRKNKKYSKAEESKAIFVTLNYSLIYVIDKYQNISRYNEIGLCISDIHLTSLLWVKSSSSNPELPKIKLISSILAGFELPNKMITKIKDTILKMKDINDNDVNTIMESIVSSNIKQASLLEMTDGDKENITEKTIIDVLNEDKDKEISKHIQNVKKYQDELNNLTIQNKEEERTRYNELAKIKDKETKFITYPTKALLYFLLFAMSLLLAYFIVYIVFTETIITSSNIFIKILIYLVAIIGYFGIYKFIIIKIKKLIDNLMNILYAKIYSLKDNKYNNVK